MVASTDDDSVNGGAHARVRAAPSVVLSSNRVRPRSAHEGSRVRSATPFNTRNSKQTHTVKHDEVKSKDDDDDDKIERIGEMKMIRTFLTILKICMRL